MIKLLRSWATVGLIALTMGCVATTPADRGETFYGTMEPFAAESIYFVVTDRFVDGDISNNFPEQGGDWPSFNVPWHGPSGREIANLGYLGGDFKGLLDNADYIAEMGFSAVWITPIVENPDAGFSGSHTPDKGPFSDHKKSGYHGYWATNFYQVDEHWESEGLRFADLTRRLQDEHDLKLVLDVVGNHGSPSFSMTAAQEGFGRLYNAQGDLVADHQNLEPEQLNPQHNRLHAFFHAEKDLAELSNLDEDNPAVVDYLVDAYLQWVAQGAAAFRIDTIRHMPNRFWKRFSDRIRAEKPDLFMFAEHFSWEADDVAQHLKPENGSISVLDFPGRKAMVEVFETDADLGFDHLLSYLHLTDGKYDNPYELMTFYDNHDMPRMNADANGFIDAHNWLFTSRGIPVIYYGSEMAFEAGKAEHAGNRNYFGVERLQQARLHPIRESLVQVANLRQSLPALQRGVQINLDFQQDTAAFLRVLQLDGINQQALVMLNKGDRSAIVRAGQLVQPGRWRDVMTLAQVNVPSSGEVSVEVPAHGVRVFVLDQAVTHPPLLREVRQSVRGIPRSCVNERACS